MRDPLVGPPPSFHHPAGGCETEAGTPGRRGRPSGLAGLAGQELRVRNVRTKVEGLPSGFRYHDLRHYYASLLIASGANVKVVQTRLRHASATTTLDTSGHLFPDQDEATRIAVETVLIARADYLRTSRDTA